MNNNIKKTLICYIILFAFIFACFAGVLFSINRVKAEELEYTDVLADLQKDKNFNTGNYPGYSFSTLPANLHEVNIIQIAEGNNRELFIYTYEPTRGNENETVELLSVTMYDGYVENGVFPNGSLRDYSLELVSESSVFCKYRVLNYSVSSEVIRYYNIHEFHREFNASFGDKLESSDAARKFAIACGIQFACSYINDKLVIEATSYSFLELKSLYIDSFFIESGFGYQWFFGRTEDHDLYFGVFTLEDEFKIDYIYDLDLEYTEEKLEWTNYTDPAVVSSNPIYETSFHYESRSVKTSGFLKKEYVWDSFYPAQDFKRDAILKGITLSESLTEKLDEDGAWVFLIDSYVTTVSRLQLVWKYSKYRLADVSMLRLHFQSGVNTYNLGVISDKVTADLIAGGVRDAITKADLQALFDKLLMILGLIGLVLILVFLSPVIWPGIKAMFKWLWEFIVAVFSLIFDGIVFLVTWPIELIKKLLK